jgi:metal-responsive CopG/Arc/MetJ family transcriptional regulator
MKTISITIDEHLLQQIDRLVAENKKSNRSQIIRQAIKEFVTQQERLTEEEREHKIFRQHRQRLARQTAALIDDQIAA